MHFRHHNHHNLNLRRNLAERTRKDAYFSESHMLPLKKFFA